MPTSPQALGSQVSAFITQYGEISRFKYYTRTYSGADYDNEFVTQSGTAAYYPVLNFPVGETSTDRDYMEQGVLLADDRKIFVAGSVSVTAFTKIGFGSPTPTYEYAPIVPIGVRAVPLSGVNVYQAVYIRRLTNGSFIGEY